MSYAEVLFRCIVAVTIPAIASWFVLEVMRWWSESKRAVRERAARSAEEML